MMFLCLNLHDFVKAVIEFGVLVDESQFKPRNVVSESVCLKRREDRLRVVLDHVPKVPVRIGLLYLRLRQNGLYGMKFRTFSRDVAELGVRGKVETEFRRGGKYGNTTLVKLKDDVCGETK
jgi:hypothetical protein